MKRPVAAARAAPLPYEALLAGSLQGVLIVAGGEIVLANDAAAALFAARDAAALAGLALADLVAPDDAKRLAAAARAAVPRHARVQGVTLDGRGLTLDTAALGLPWQGRRAVQIALLDAGALAEREAQFHHIIDGSLQGIYVHAEHRLLFANRTLAEMFGYDSPEAVLAMGDAQRLYAPEEVERLDGFYRARQQGRDAPVRYEFQGLRADGQRVWLENQVRIVTWQGQQAALATVIDISERKRAERELQASEEKYRHVVENSLMGILVQRDRHALFANQAFADIFGYDGPQELYALDNLMPLIGADSREDMIRFARARLGGEPAPSRYVGHGKRKDGSDIWCETSVRVVTFEGAPALQVTVIDVTDRLRAERALEAQRRLLETVFHTIPHSLFVKDADQRYVMVNRAFCETLAVRAEDVLGRTLDEIGYGDDALRERVGREERQVLASGEPLVLRDMPLELPDGRISRRHVIRAPFFDEDGRPAGLMCITEDVTERLAAEERVRANERLMRMVLDRLPYLVFVKDRRGRFQFVNAAFATFHGSVPEHFVGRTLHEIPFGEARIETLVETDRQVLEQGEPVEVRDLRMASVGGAPGIFHLQKLPLHDDSGAIVGLVGLCEELTERMRAQEALRASQRLLRTVIDTIPHAIFVKDMQGRFQIVNQAYADFYGRTVEECVGLRYSEVESIADNRLELFDETDRRLIEGGVPVEIPEVTLLRPRGPASVRHIIKMPLRDGTGRLTGIVGVSEDITERKRAEEELRTSQRLLRTVIDTLPHAIYMRDTEGRYRIVNRAMASHMGLSIKELMGKRLGDFGGWTPPRERLAEADTQVIHSGQVVEIPEMAIPDAQGRESIRHVVKIPLLDDTGAVTGVVGVSEDITERKRAEEELRSSRMLLETVFNLLPLWVFVKDRQRRFLMINRQMAEDYALTESVEPGKRIDLSTSITEEERTVIYELDQRVLDSGERVEVPEVQITLPRGDTRLFRTVRIPLRDAAGAVTGILGIAEDITERRRTEQAIQQAQKLESLGVLAGGVAHDFNNLLVSILGNASLAMLDLPPDSPALPPLTQVETAGQRAAELCRQMLAYSGKGSFEIATVNLNDLIEEMTQLLRVSLARSITLTYRFAEALPAVEVDPTQIRQVVMNLVMNAAEAIGEQPGAITVTTADVQADRGLLMSYVQGDALPEGRYVLLEVRDTGVGIPPEMLGRIFDPFFTTKFAGRGLGLAAVLGIVRGHQGAMQVVSAPGEGSTFRMLLPAAGVAAESPGHALAGIRWRGQGTALIVDDETEVRDVLERMMRSLGFAVLAVADGHEALRLLDAHGDDLRVVLLDITMPGLDGMATLRQVRERNAALPVVLVSGYAEREVEQQFSGHGANAVLQKPFTLHTLAARLEALLG